MADKEKKERKDKIRRRRSIMEDDARDDVK